MRDRLPKLMPAWILGTLLALADCAHAPGKGMDRDVTLRLTNSGAEPLRCSIVFGHWVYRELGTLAPGQTHNIAMIQAAKDGALYVNRFDGERQMMIENLICGRMENWRDSRGQIDLASVRSTQVTGVVAQCAAPKDYGKIICNVTEIAH